MPGTPMMTFVSNSFCVDRLGPLPPVPQKTSAHSSSSQSQELGFEDHTHRSALSPSHSSPQLSGGYAPNGGLPLGTGRGGYSSKGYASSVGGAGSRNSSDLDTTSSIVGGTGGGVTDAPTTLQLAAALRLDGSHDSGFSSANNMYNVHSQRTSHYESTDQLRSPVSTSSEPGAVSPLQSQFLAQEKSLSGAGGHSSGSVVPGNEPFQRATYGSSASGPQGRTLLQYGSLDRKRTPPNLSGVNASGDHPAYQHYRTEVYRDLSPVRYKGRTLQEEDFDRGNIGGLCEEPVNPKGIVLEVAVQHQPSQSDRGRSVPPSSSSSSLSSSASSSKPPQPCSPGSGSQYSSGGGHPNSQQFQLQQQHASQRLPGPPVEQHCYSPRMYESGPHRGAYQDLDISHIHARNVVSAAVAAAAQQEYAAAASRDGNSGSTGFHHTASQPVFHRRERSLSPHTTSQQQQQHSYLQYQPRQEPPSDYRHQQQQQEHQSQIPYQEPGSSSLQQHYSSGYSSPPASLDSPRSIPIQRVETPPLHHAPHHSSSPSSGPSSPRGVAGAGLSAAPSSLVTVSRLQPHTEVTKPYELADFYRYSEKLRRQRIIDQYQRQLIGNMVSPDRMSRSSSPQSVDSDGHSSLSGSASQHSGSASSAGHASFSTSATYHPQHPPRQQQQGQPPVYNRSGAGLINNTNPIQVMSSSQFYHTSRPLSPLSSTYDPQTAIPASHYPDGHVTSSSSSSYTVKSSGPSIHFAVQSSSSFHMQQVHSTAKHAVYTPPQPMACKPIKKPPAGAGLDLQKR
ncbi:FERM domain-containing protein 4A [Elysia marginata]|uniref:FERM domain-containing protein 4A n=1 Tax=Elysia marginata TaxID=1093978 RepID=A0AAV4F6F0_9GAST|nr:FERM domain-containing protein 4A [Elysia marginata]